MVRDWLVKKACKKRDIESLLGHLQHAATVVRPGHTLVRHLIKLVSTVQTQDRWICLSTSTRSDLNYWVVFMEKWNGVFMLPNAPMLDTPLSRCLWLLGLRSPLGIMVVTVEMVWSIDRVANSLCSSDMGRALWGTASGMPL